MFYLFVISNKCFQVPIHPSIHPCSDNNQSEIPLVEWGIIPSAGFSASSVMTHSLPLKSEDSRSMERWILASMCTSERQSNMTAIYTHRVRRKLLSQSFRPSFHLKEWKDRQSRRGACRCWCSGLSHLFLSTMACTWACELHKCVSACMSRPLSCWRGCICPPSLSSQVVSDTGSRTVKKANSVFKGGECPCFSLFMGRWKHWGTTAGQANYRRELQKIYQQLWPYAKLLTMWPN